MPPSVSPLATLCITPSTGRMVSFWPIRSSERAVMSLAHRIVLMLMPYFRAIPPMVSPCSTTYVSGFEMAIFGGVVLPGGAGNGLETPVSS
jgi:hypothetical protein